MLGLSIPCVHFSYWGFSEALEVSVIVVLSLFLPPLLPSLPPLGLSFPPQVSVHHIFYASLHLKSSVSSFLPSWHPPLLRSRCLRLVKNKFVRLRWSWGGRGHGGHHGSHWKGAQGGMWPPWKSACLACTEP